MKSLFLLFRSKIYTALILLIIIFVIGVIGFKSVDGFSWIDAIYMTVITISTVGFSEVHPLDDQAKLFATGLILSSVIILGYAIKVITEYVLSKSNIRGVLQKENAKKKLTVWMNISLYVDTEKWKTSSEKTSSL